MGEDVTVAYFSSDAWKYVFNTPLECGLRCAILLRAAFPARCDLQRLLQYEYLLVHSGDIVGGPPSLHPSTPHRAGELLVRRSLIERGLLFMMARSVICREFSTTGIVYYAGEWAAPFLDMLTNEYTSALQSNAKWIVERFGNLPDTDLNRFMRDNWSNWGSEFTKEAFLRGSST